MSVSTDSLGIKQENIKLLTTSASPRDGEKWIQRMVEEYKILVDYIAQNKEEGNDWISIESNENGTTWNGTCKHVYKGLTYEFQFQFDIQVIYPSAPPELAIPELEGKTVKMYRGGKICLSSHFAPLWARNQPHYGIAHLLALGLAPWLAVEVPNLVEEGMIIHPSALK
ncbi:MAG: putative Ubiquitin-fold modifier-conjugating enzyme 1 [Streblomastix strix]|uniref:Ubiquitin-fold modifier-conjugating enzyme 1 n=1 Tax=Streblomastix strix TaxID=222440 RepID=A0A5J4VXJ4_9EUKA|nr:MAG: putative Ubiquitin-fold modifier-conjugating enzyme 1 [Streblomastix strix]